MQKYQGQNNLNRATEEAGGVGRGLRRTPPSPAIPPKRAKVAAENGGPEVPVFLQELTDTSSSIGHSILLRVVVTGRPQPHLSWYKEQVLIIPSEEEEEGENEYGSLWIRSSKAEDAGIYTCVAKNEHGKAVTSATVKIMGMEGTDRVGSTGPVGFNSGQSAGMHLRSLWFGESSLHWQLATRCLRRTAIPPLPRHSSRFPSMVSG